MPEPLTQSLQNHERELLTIALAYATIRKSPSGDPWPLPANCLRGRSYPENLSLRLCAMAHDGHEWWAEDDTLVCGVCHPPAGPALTLRDGIPCEIEPNARLGRRAVPSSPAPAPRRTLRKGPLEGQESML